VFFDVIIQRRFRGRADLIIFLPLTVVRVGSLRRHPTPFGKLLGYLFGIKPHSKQNRTNSQARPLFLFVFYVY